MKYFEVRREVLVGLLEQYNVLSDGEMAGTSDSQGEQKEITTGFSVWEYEEDGTTIKVEFYPVTTDTLTWEDNSEEQLSKIHADYPPTEWQNHEW